MEAITSLDVRILEALYAVRDPLVVQVLIWVSELGRVPTVYGLAAIIALALLLKRHYAYAAGLAISVVTSGLGILVTKGLIERGRPDQFYQAYLESWHSFPSAHAALGAALYGFLMYTVWHLSPTPYFRYISLAAGIVIIGSIGISRVYLGVHYASDILAGLVLGVVCVWLGVKLTTLVRSS